MKRKLATGIGLLLVFGLAIGGVAAKANHVFSGFSIKAVRETKNTAYPDLVARIGDQEITGLDLSREITAQEASWGNIGKPKSKAEYEQWALKKLVSNALLDEEARKRGIQVNPAEVEAIIAQNVGYLKSLPEGHPDRVEWTVYLQDMGFASFDDFAEAADIQQVYEQLLIRGKLKEAITNEAASTAIKEETGLDPAVLREKREAVWANYEKQLLENKNAYELFVAIDIQNVDDSYEANFGFKAGSAGKMDTVGQDGTDRAAILIP